MSLVVRLLPERAQGIVGCVTHCCGFILFALIAWRCVLYAFVIQASGEVSMTLQLPFYPFIYGIGFSAGCVCLIEVLDAVKCLLKVIGK